MKELICSGSATEFLAPETGDSVFPSWEKDTTGLCKGVTAVARDRASLCQRTVSQLSWPEGLPRESERF